MERDIDRIIGEIRRRVPSVQIDQMQKLHAADDDGLWWFRLPGIKHDIQIESSTGNCPFLIEADDTAPISVQTVEAVIDVVSRYLAGLQGPG